MEGLGRPLLQVGDEQNGKSHRGSPSSGLSESLQFFFFMSKDPM